MKNWFRKIRRTATLVAVLSLVILPITMLGGSARAKTFPDTFPRLANYYLKSPISVSEARLLARWDVVILGRELQYTSPAIFPILRELNPDILLLAYAPSEEFVTAQRDIADPQHPDAIFAAGVADEWFLTDAAGNRISNWPGTQMLNVTLQAPVVNGRQWATYLPTFMHDHIMATGLWDGIFYDNVWPDIAWMNGGDIDLNRDGQTDSTTELNAAWAAGMESLLAYSRRLEGDNAVIIGNGGGQYYTSLNGRLMEEFPSDSDGGWTGAMKLYLNVMQRGALPPMVVLNGKSSTGLATDEQAMRLTLASTLMDGGFASFDFGTQRHADLWWYDEYGLSLGMPVSGRRNLLKNGATLEPGLWRRDFQNGIVLLNSTATARTVELADAYEELTRSGSPKPNDGRIVTSVVIGPFDGKFMLRRQFSIDRGQYQNGSFVRAFSAGGSPIRQAFLTYTEGIDGGADIIKEDLDGDGNIETVVAAQNRVRVLTSDGRTIAGFSPYGRGFRRAVSLAVGDLDGDGFKEIITGAGNGGGPHVRTFTRTGRPLSPGFFAYAKTFRGGVHVAAGDLDGDGRDEIITGAGQRGGPQVRIFDKHGRALGGFFAYDKGFRGGVDVAVGDVTGDGSAEIVTAPGRGGSPHIRILSARGREVRPSFYAFDRSFRAGVTVSVLDANGDLVNDILIAAPTLY